MNADTQRQLAEYKAQIDAKYAGMRARNAETLAAEEAEKKRRKRRDDWLLINPQGRIDGVAARWCHESATEAFELFFPTKRERMKRAAEGWHIEQDDEYGTRFEENASSFEKAANEGA